MNPYSILKLLYEKKLLLSESIIHKYNIKEGGDKVRAGTSSTRNW